MEESNKSLGINISIIIGVSNYKNISSLPGCENDVNLMKDLLNLTNKYHDSLVISEDTDAVIVKEQLSEFITKQKSNTINEVFFYFTGHGYFDGNEFRYILSDFDKDKMNQTTLSNMYLDNLLRSLNANFTVKVVDACNSGVPYIKSIDDTNKYFEEIEKGINNCCFMYSSNSSQSSFQRQLSYFTKSFVNSILIHSGTQVGYINIIDGIKDCFATNSKQTPYFIVQGPLTEKFCTLTDAIRELRISDYEQIKPDKISKEGASSILDLIVKDAKRYCSKDEFLNLISEIKDTVDHCDLDEELKGLYSLKKSFENGYSSVGDLAYIGKWLARSENDYFVEVVRVNKSGDYFGVLTHSLISLASPIEGIRSDLDIPFKSIIINADPQHPNIRRYNCTIAFIASKTDIRFFFYYTFYKEVAWGNFSLNENIQWETENAEIKDSEKVKEIIIKILNGFFEYIDASVRMQFNLESGKIQ